MTPHLTAAAVLLVGLAVLGVVLTARAGTRRARRAVHGIREITRITASVLWMLTAAAVIVGVQWAVIATHPAPAVIAVVLGAPGLLAGLSVARLLAVTTVIRTVGIGRNRRVPR